MKITETIAQARDSITVKRVFGDAYEKDGVTIIPAAWVAGGGGGGGEPDGGEGSGFGLAAFPVGAYVIKDGDVTWSPALNVTWIVLACLFTLRTVVKARARRRR